MFFITITNFVVWPRNGSFVLKYIKLSIILDYVSVEVERLSRKYYYEWSRLNANQLDYNFVMVCGVNRRKKSIDLTADKHF